MVIFTARQNLANLNEVNMNLIVKFANLAGKSYNTFICKCNKLVKNNYTVWPRRNATTFILNFMNIVDETYFYFFLGKTFIFQQNDTMIISFG